MRVLSVGNMYPPHHYGGYELIWESAVEALRGHGHAVRVLTTDLRKATSAPDAADVHRELRWKHENGRFEASGPLDRLRLVRHNHRVLERHITEFQPTVVAWWSMGGLSLTLLEDVRRRRIPAVAFVIDDWLDYGPKVDEWLRTFTGPRRSRGARLAEAAARVPARVDFANAATYLFVSEHTREKALAGGVRLDRTEILNAGIDPAFLTPSHPASGPGTSSTSGESTPGRASTPPSRRSPSCRQRRRSESSAAPTRRRRADCGA